MQTQTHPQPVDATLDLPVHDTPPSCCAGRAAAQTAVNDTHTTHHAHHAHGAHGAHAGTPAGLATAATVHCLTGCAIGELAGLAIGVSLGLGAWPTMLLATALGFLGGYALGLWPLVRRGSGWLEAFKLIWIGETVSIAVMEFAMNFTDYHVGGVQAASVFEWRFWFGYAAALPAGFVVAWPVNYWLLARNLKKACH